LAVVIGKTTRPEVTIHARETRAAAGCLRKCDRLKENRTAIHKYGHRRAAVRDTTLGGKPVTLVIDRQRYRCIVLHSRPLPAGRNRWTATGTLTARMVEYIAPQVPDDDQYGSRPRTRH